MGESIVIAGVPVKLAHIERNELKGLNLDMVLSFRFYKTVFNQYELCIAEAVDPVRNYTPRQYSHIASLVERTLKIPVAFRLQSAPSYIRSRLIEQGVYFILSDQYVFLPSLLINERIKQKGNIERPLSPIAQYTLLYYLLHKEIAEFTIQEIQPKTPYNYLGISRAIIELEEKQLFHVQKEWKTKLISSPFSRKELWKNAMQFLSSPVKRTVYTDKIWKAPFYKGGITALSHYSFLNPDDQQTAVIWEKDFKPENNPYYNWDDAESMYKIEIWKYSPQIGTWQNEYVDKLSLYLSMQDDNDPRVEKELETIIDKIWQ